MDQSEFGALDLARAKPAAKLPDAFHDAEQTASRAGMSVPVLSTVGGFYGLFALYLGWHFAR